MIWWGWNHHLRRTALVEVFVCFLPTLLLLPLLVCTRGLTF